MSRLLKFGAKALIAAAGVYMMAAPLLLEGCSRRMAVRNEAVAYENRGDQYYEKGDWDAALREYTKALELGSQKLKVYNNLGNVHYRRGAMELAQKYYDMALLVDPDYLFSLNNTALTHLRLQNHAEAVKVLEAGLRRFPASALLWNSLAMVHLKQGNLAKGIEFLKKSLTMNPDYAVALNNLADVYLKHPDFNEDPLPLILRAIDKDPDNMLLYDTLGWYYCQAGIFDEALIALGKAIIQDPENPEIMVHYATVLEWIGKEKEAMEQWRSIMELPLDKETASLARTHYWQLKGR